MLTFLWQVNSPIKHVTARKFPMKYKTKADANPCKDFCSSFSWSKALDWLYGIESYLFLKIDKESVFHLRWRPAEKEKGVYYFRVNVISANHCKILLEYVK